jgi:hypothetical protein
VNEFVKLGFEIFPRFLDSKRYVRFLLWVKNFNHVQLQVNVTVAIANWEGVGRKASARDNRKGLK